MFASVRRYRLESGSIDDLLHLVDMDFAESVQEMDGFMEYQVLECGNGEIITITLETPSNPAMNRNQYNFSHANGEIKATLQPKL